MLTRITITISAEEREILRQLAEREVRGLKDHIRYILRQEVKRLGAQAGLEGGEEREADTTTTRSS